MAWVPSSPQGNAACSGFVRQFLKRTQLRSTNRSVRLWQGRASGVLQTLSWPVTTPRPILCVAAEGSCVVLGSSNGVVYLLSEN